MLEAEEAEYWGLIGLEKPSAFIQGTTELQSTLAY